MDLSSILATGGMSGGVVAVAYLVYLFCKSRRSKCTSNCSSDEAAAASSPTSEPGGWQLLQITFVAASRA